MSPLNKSVATAVTVAALNLAFPARAQVKTGDGSKATPLRKVTTASSPANGTASSGTANSAGPTSAGAASAVSAHKPPLAPSGTWTWMTYSPSMQPEQNSITLTSDGRGNVKATLTDWLGTHDVKAVTVGDGTISFDVMYHYRGFGDFPHTFTVSLDPDSPSVTVQRPDFSALGKVHGGKRSTAHAAKHLSG